MIIKFDQYIKEGLTDKMKPKSEEEIRKSIKNMNHIDKLKISCQKNIYWLAKESINELGYNKTKDIINNEEMFINLIKYYNMDVNIFKLLIDNGLNLSHHPNLLIEIVESENIESVKLLIDEKLYDIHYNNDLSLLKAITTGNVDMVKLLVSYGADVEKILRIFKLKSKKYYSDYSDELNENIKEIIKYLESII